MSELQVEQLPLVKQSIREQIDNHWQNPDSNASGKKKLFLEGLRETGTVLHAAKLSKINRRTAYLWRDTDPEFKAAWNDALEDTTDVIERSLYNQAKSEKNVIATIFYLKGNRAKYKDRLTVDVNSLDREIEDRLSTLDSDPKGIISEVISSPKQLTE